jgi:hypothetical protein
VGASLNHPAVRFFAVVRAVASQTDLHVGKGTNVLRVRFD